MLEDYSDVLNIDDLCEILHISRKSAYRFLKQGEIPYKRIGRVYRIRKSVLIDFFNK